MGTQADEEPEGWQSFSLGRALQLLHSLNQGVVRRTLRRLHVRFWYMVTKRMQELLRHAGAPQSAIKTVPEIVETCRVCRMWTRPTARSMTRTRLAQEFKAMVQWDLLVACDWMLSHCLDEALRWSIFPRVPSKSLTHILGSITLNLLRRYRPMKGGSSYER